MQAGLYSSWFRLAAHTNSWASVVKDGVDTGAPGGACISIPFIGGACCDCRLGVSCCDGVTLTGPNGGILSCQGASGGLRPTAFRVLV